jgi:multidrug resistance efflux pump
VVEVPVVENQVVPAGTVLLRLDSDLATHQADEARADLKAAEAQLAEARSLPEQHRARLAMQRDAIEAAQNRLAAAQQVLERKRSLRESKLANDEDVRIAEFSVKELTAASRGEQQKLRELELQDPAVRVALAEQTVQARKARLEQARHRLAECELKAPVAGQVLRVLAAPGEMAGGPGKQPVIQFCPDQPRIVRAEVPQGFAHLLTVGQPVSLQDDVRPEETWHGTVARVSDWYTQRRSILQEPSQHNDVRTVECIVRIDPGQSALRIGQRLLVLFNRRPEVAR